MKAAVCTKYGPPEVLEIQDVEKPTIKDNEVLVKVVASSVNSGDVRTRGLIVDGPMRIVMRVAMGFRGPRNPILGVAMSGAVEEAGSQVSNFKKGDQVFASIGLKMGCHAEYAKVRADKAILLKPKKMSHEEAAAIPFGGNTAMHFLRKAGIKNAKNVLIYGATGSVGVAAVQVAKSYGATVTAVCSDKGISLVKELGADEVINYKKEDFTKTDTRFDVILDAVGKTSKKECRDLLAEDGKFVTVAGLDIAKDLREDLEYLVKLYEKGQYQAVIDKVYPFEEIVEAHRYVEKGHKQGNVVIQIG